MENLIPIATILLGGAVLNFVQFLITRRDNKKEKEKKEKEEKPLDAIVKRLDELEKTSDLRDSRTQMLILMNHYPKDTYQLLEMARHYFVDLGGDWWMSSLFKQHCSKNEIPLPNWFKDDSK